MMETPVYVYVKTRRNKTEDGLHTRGSDNLKSHQDEVPSITKCFSIKNMYAFLVSPIRSMYLQITFRCPDNNMKAI